MPIEKVATEVSAIANTADNGALILFGQSGSTPKLTYSSWQPKTMEEKKAYFNAINAPTGRLKECVNMELPVRHIFAETVNFVDQATGEVSDGVRMVFILEDGRSYQAASKGIFNAVSKLFAVVGEPSTWAEPVTIRVREIGRGVNSNVLTFDLA